MLRPSRAGPSCSTSSIDDRGAGLDETIVVLGDDAEPIEAAVDWRCERRVRNPDPSRDCRVRSTSGSGARRRRRRGACRARRPAARLGRGRSAPCWTRRADRRPTHRGARSTPTDGGRNPVLLRRAAFGLVARGDRRPRPRADPRAHPELVARGRRSTARNPDVDTPRGPGRDAGDRVGRARPGQPRAGRPRPRGPRRHRLLCAGHRPLPGRPDADRRTGPGRAAAPGPARARRGSTSGRARAATPCRSPGPSRRSGGARDRGRSVSGMLGALREIAAEHGIANVRVVEARWPPGRTRAPFARMSR